MIRLSTDHGQIAVDAEVYTNIAGSAATKCFGVKGMVARSMTDGLVHLLRREAMGKGVEVVFNQDDTVTITLGAQQNTVVIARWAVRSVEDAPLENDVEPEI